MNAEQIRKAGGKLVRPAQVKPAPTPAVPQPITVSAPDVNVNVEPPVVHVTVDAPSPSGMSDAMNEITKTLQRLNEGQSIRGWDVVVTERERDQRSGYMHIKSFSIQAKSEGTE